MSRRRTILRRFCLTTIGVVAWAVVFGSAPGVIPPAGDVAYAQNGNGNAGGNSNGNAGGDGNGNAGGNGNGNAGGNGNGNAGGNGNGNAGNGNGNAGSDGAGKGEGESEAGTAEASGLTAAPARSPEGVIQSGQQNPAPEASRSFMHNNGMQEFLQGGRYEMRDAKGRVIINREATITDYRRFGW